MKKKVELTVGHTSAVHMANYSILVEVASAALGGGKDKGKDKHDEDLSSASPEHFAARVAAMTSL